MTTGRSCYITALGTFLPGQPVDNASMEDVLGLVHGRRSVFRARVLERNGIRTRHYAQGPDGVRTHTASGMAALAVRDALARAGCDPARVQHLAAATTLSDVLVPGFASLVHGESGIPACEVASLGGVCAGGMAALASAEARVRAGLCSTAVACAGEFASRHLRGSVLERSGLCDAKGRLPFDAEFLRWMLSDGAGAAVLSDRPAGRGLSLRIDWIDSRSHADTREICMYAGALKTAGGGVERLWADHPSYDRSVAEGMFTLRQDMAMVESIVPLGIAHYFRLIDQGRIAPPPDWLVCHYSSLHFRSDIVRHLDAAGAGIPSDSWYSNLPEVGNVGSASVFLLLAGLMRDRSLTPGQRIVVMIPESGRFITAFMHLTVVDPTTAADEPRALAAAAITAARAEVGLDGELLRRLWVAWSDFAESLHRVPIVARIESGRATLDDYRILLANLRQQVVEGSRWIARAASGITAEHCELRSLFVRHAVEEHRDYQMLERDYASVGGDVDEMRRRPKNIGSEALSAWMFHSASVENPFALIGAMAMIEGLGTRLAGGWGESLRRQLGLATEQLSFLLYHAQHDDGHLDAMARAIALLPLDRNLLERTVRTAQVTARLYRLQLEELDPLP